jgi:hypothetical protein
MKKYRNHTTGNDNLDIKNLQNLRRMELYMISILESQKQKDGVSCGVYCMFAMTLIPFKTHTANWQKWLTDQIHTYLDFAYVNPHDGTHLIHPCKRH